MADHTLKKVTDWLKFQEEVYGAFRLPRPYDGFKVTNEPPREPVAAGDAADSRSLADPYAGLSGISDLEELNKYCQQANILRTDLEGTNLVFGVGNARADLMLIGEAPGEQEDRQGEPFVGKAGQLLNKILKAISFERDQVYIANILKHRPPDNRDPQPEERENSLPILEKQIDLINPKLILCLGRISAQTLLETAAPMKELRGRFHRYRDKYEVLVTYHPAALLRNPDWKRGTWEDVQLLRKRYDELGCQP